MTIKNLKERLTEQDFCYIVFPNKENVIEFTDPEKAHIYTRIFGGIFYDHFPYAEYGFEDPYTFVNTWVFTNEDGDIIEYVVNDNDVQEVEVDVDVF